MSRKTIKFILEAHKKSREIVIQKNILNVFFVVNET